MNCYFLNHSLFSCKYLLAYFFIKYGLLYQTPYYKYKYLIWCCFIKEIYILHFQKRIYLFFRDCYFLLLLARHLSIITIWIKFLYHILRSDSKVRSYPFWKNKSFKPSQTLFDVQWCIYAKPLRPLNTFSQQQKWKYWICRSNIINEHWQQELQNETDRWTIAGR